MKITKVSIRNFRSIHTLDFDTPELTAICGPNSCGKSNVLRALRFAFLPSFSQDRMPDNVCSHVVAPNVSCRVTLTFDTPTQSLATSLGLPNAQPFTYSVSVKRNGTPTFQINGTRVTEDRRKALLDGILVVHVPPIRDIAAEGLKPFKDTLAYALGKTRGAGSFAQLNSEVKSAVKARGRTLLGGTRSLAQQLLRVDELVVDTDGIDLDQLLPSAALKVRIGNKEISLDKLGTGHQSTVILKLYRQLGEETGRFVLYLFEEPDNHLHPTSLRAIAEDLAECSAEQDSQVFLTTHSPYLLNQFDLQKIVALTSDTNRLTVKRPKSVRLSDREVRIALGKYGLKPAEALLASKVIVVEGLNDVTVLRTAFELETGLSPDRQDVLIIPAGGKQPVADLALFLQQLGATWHALLDWDATENTSTPIFQTGLSAADSALLRTATASIRAKLHLMPNRDTQAVKLMTAMDVELAAPVVPRASSYAGSILDNFVRKLAGLDATQLLALERATVRRQRMNVRQLLSPKGISVWSGTIEEVILRNPAAENDAETALRAAGEIRGVIDPAHRRRRLLNALKQLAHSPEIMRGIVEQLWRNGRFTNSELKSTVRLFAS